MQSEALEGNNFQKVKTKIKGTIYEVLFILLKDEESGAWKLGILRMIDFFQLMVFPFSGDAQFPWKAGNFFQSLQNVIEVFQIISYITSFPWITYLIVFYLGILLVVLVILDIIYVLYSIAIKKFSYIWPLKALASFCSIFVTVLFLPLLKLFISMISCKTSASGQMVHAYYANIACWQGMHILHAILAIVVSVVFILISLIVTLAFFEAKTLTSNAGAKINSRTDFFLILYKILCIILFAFLYDKEYSWILVLVIFFGSLWNYYRCKVELPYYNSNISLLWNITNGVYLWVNLSLLVCMILQDTSFDGGIQLIGLGVPLIGFMEYYFVRNREKYMSKRIDDMASASDCALFLRYLMDIIYMQKTKDNQIILEAYIKQHSASCVDERCSITVYLKGRETKQEKRNLDKRKAFGATSEKLLLYNHVKVSYKKALHKFPRSASLRIRYAFFLLEYLDNKTASLIQFKKAENLNPAIDEDFVIYRYKRILNETLSESRHQGVAVGMDLVSIMAYDNYYRQCKILLEKATQLHVEFWSKLNVAVPDVGQLMKIGAKINQVITGIEEYWALMQKINANKPDALKKYAQFVKEILNDPDTANELLKSIRNGKKGKINAQEEGQDENDYLINIYSRDGTACLCVSAEPHTLGNITRANMSSCRLLGYAPEDIIGKNISSIQPNCIANVHQQILTHAAENVEEVRLMGKELGLPILHKNGYLVLSYVTLRSLPSFLNGMNFIATFKPDKLAETKEICALIISPQGFIMHVSEKAVTMLHLTCEEITKNKIKLEDIAPALEMKNYSNFMNDGGLTTFNVSQNTPQADPPSNPLKIILNCTISILKADCIHLSLLGYIVKLVKDTPNRGTTLKAENNIKLRNMPCQFIYDTSQNKYARRIVASGAEDQSDSIGYIGGENEIPENEDEYKEDLVSPMDLGSENNGGVQKLSIKDILVNSANYTFDQFMNAIATNNKDYAKGIVTYRLEHGEYLKIKSQKTMLHKLVTNDENVEEHEKFGSKNKKINNKMMENARIAKSRKAYQSYLAVQPTPKAIRNLLGVSAVLFICAIVLTSVEYTVSEEAATLISGSLAIAWDTAQLRIALSSSVYDCMSLALLQENITTNYEGTHNSTEYENYLRMRIMESSHRTHEYAETIAKSITTFEDVNKEFGIKEDFKLALFSSTTGTIKQVNVTILEAFNQLNAAVIELSALPLSAYNLNNRNLYFLRYNMMNGLPMKESYTETVLQKAQLEYTSERVTLLRNIMISALCICFCAAVLMLPFLIKAYWAKEEVLSYFLRIPKTAVSRLHEKCERYYQYQQKEEAENEATIRDADSDKEREMDATADEAAQANEEDNLVESGRKEIKLRSTSNTCALFWKIFMAMIAIDSYFVFAYVFIDYIKNVIDKRNLQNNCGCILSISTVDAMAQLREVSLNSSIPIYYSMDRTDLIAKDYIKMRESSEEFVRQNMVTDSLYLGNHIEYVDSWLHGSICPDWESDRIFSSLTICEEFLYGITKKGVYSLFMEFYFLLKQHLSSIYIKTSKELFNTNKWEMMKTMARDLFPNAFKKYSTYLQTLVTDMVANTIRIKLIVMLVYLFTIIIAFLAFWLPFVMTLRTEIWRTNSMITLIPSDVIENNRFLKEAFEKRLAMMTNQKQIIGTITD